jgi:hypothetical protein
MSQVLQKSRLRRSKEGRTTASPTIRRLRRINGISVGVYLKFEVAMLFLYDGFDIAQDMLCALRELFRCSPGLPVK